MNYIKSPEITEWRVSRDRILSYQYEGNKLAAKVYVITVAYWLFSLAVERKIFLLAFFPAGFTNSCSLHSINHNGYHFQTWTSLYQHRKTTQKADLQFSNQNHTVNTECYNPAIGKLNNNSYSRAAWKTYDGTVFHRKMKVSHNQNVWRECGNFNKNVNMEKWNQIILCYVRTKSLTHTMFCPNTILSDWPSVVNI